MTVLTGGSAQHENGYVGLARDVRVDDDNGNLRVHDGVTPGGNLIPNRDQNDARYQRRSPELDGLAGFEPQEKGVLVRLGPSDYVVRSFKVNTANLSVANGSGLAGDPTFALAATISTDHRATGAWTFERGLSAPAGFTGNLTGDVLGDLVGDSLGKHTGAVDVRGKSLSLDDGQIQMAKIAGLAEALAAAGAQEKPFFVGMTMLWSGEAADIPPGWRLCDGTRNTPNLVDRFIVGGIATGAIGGSKVHLHTATSGDAGSHEHDATGGATSLLEMHLPPHKHKNGVGDNSAGNELFCYGSTPTEPQTTPDSLANNDPNGTYQGWTSTVGSGQPHSHTVDVQAGGLHAHEIKVEPSNHLPPYYTSCIIMYFG